jgi:hypothetical protein
MDSDGRGYESATGRGSRARALRALAKVRIVISVNMERWVTHMPVFDRRFGLVGRSGTIGAMRDNRIRHTGKEARRPVQMMAAEGQSSVDGIRMTVHRVPPY